MTTLDEQVTGQILFEVLHERRRQHRTFGEQNAPDGTGGAFDRGIARNAQAECGAKFDAGCGTFRHILWEEVAEAFAETNPARLRAELVQVAAVAVAWIEKIDRAP